MGGPVDLPEFVRQRLDEQEAAAGAHVPLAGDTHRHLISGPAWREHSHLGGGEPHEHDPETGFQIPPRAAPHDPARTLRDVAAKRAMLAELTRWPFDYRPGCDDVIRLFMRLLGSVDSDHPDYQQDWKP